jgi:8-oxo-dGTP diphosphatase
VPLAYGDGVAVGDGNGWVQCRCGRRHWGLHGAAGLLLLRTGDITGWSDPRPAAAQVLLQLRAAWTHEGGTWGLPGGAADSHEDAVTAALREAHEEAGVEPAAVRVVTTRVGVDHADWRYTYVVGLALPQVQPRVRNAESDELRWVPLPQVPELPLHEALAAAWPLLGSDLLAVGARLDGRVSRSRRARPPGEH